MPLPRTKSKVDAVTKQKTREHKKSELESKNLSAYSKDELKQMEQLRSSFVMGEQKDSTATQLLGNRESSPSFGRRDSTKDQAQVAQPQTGEAPK